MFNWICSVFSSVLRTTGKLSDPSSSTDSWGRACPSKQVTWAWTPSVNIDGTPMCGSVDANGNPYGVTSHDSFGHDSFSSGSNDW